MNFFTQTLFVAFATNMSYAVALYFMLMTLIIIRIVSFTRTKDDSQISLLRNATRIDTDSPVRDMAVNGRRTGIR